RQFERDSQPGARSEQQQPTPPPVPSSIPETYSPVGETPPAPTRQAPVAVPAAVAEAGIVKVADEIVREDFRTAPPLSTPVSAVSAPAAPAPVPAPIARPAPPPVELAWPSDLM